ncbi:MAG: phospholipase [Bacteroidetes bacterium]|nr:phospholipase [Fibrella sp.]
MSVEHHMSVSRTARYYTLGALTDQTTHVWFCLHGFGQLARFFSKKFEGLVNDHTFVVVPEGLSRLYLDGKYDRVGASWMTREDRQHEIDDFLAYLHTLFETVLAGRDPATLHITILGFSQGAATACRWLNSRGPIRADRLILWAGFFAHGLADLIDPARLADVDTHYVYGTQDEFFTLIADVEDYKAKLLAEVPTLKITAFDGPHRVETEVLLALVG